MKYEVLDIMDIVERENDEASYIPEDAAQGYAELTVDEIIAINYRIAELAENEDVFACLWKARKSIYNSVRAVKAENSGSKFVGFGAGGDDEIDLVKVRPQDIVRNGTALTQFLTTITSTGVQDYESDSGGGYVKLSKYESRVYCGWVDPIDSPKAIGILIDHQGAQRKYRVDLLWSLIKDYPVIPHVPVLLRPNTTYKIQARYNVTGDDALEPVAVIAKIASQIGL